METGPTLRLGRKATPALTSDSKPRGAEGEGSHHRYTVQKEHGTDRIRPLREVWLCKSGYLRLSQTASMGHVRKPGGWKTGFHKLAVMYMPLALHCAEHCRELGVSQALVYSEVTEGPGAVGLLLWSLWAVLRTYILESCQETLIMRPDTQG